MSESDRKIRGEERGGRVTSLFHEERKRGRVTSLFIGL